MHRYKKENYYYGRVCEKHPELKGLRSKARRTCLKCQNEASYRSRRKASDKRVHD